MPVLDQALEKLTALIAEGALQKGDRLPAERRLVELLGTGRSSVREAIRTLETLGLVRSRQGSGCYLTEDAAAFSRQLISRRSSKKYRLLEVMEARRVLECETAALAAERITPAGREALLKALAALSPEQPDELFMESDFAFHQVVATLSGNFLLLEMLTGVSQLSFEANMRLVVSKPGQKQTAIEHHRRICAALLAGDPDRARLEMRLHIDNVVQAPERHPGEDENGRQNTCAICD